MAHLLPILVLIPLLCGIGLTLLPRGRDEIVKAIALAVSLVTFLLSIVVATGFSWFPADGQVHPTVDPWYQMTGAIPWAPALGVSFSYGVDSISMSLILLTTFMMPLTILGAFGDVKQRTKEFFLWLLVLEGALIGVFVATDIIFFYICFELTLVPLYFLIGIFGSDQKHWASVKFFIFTLTGSLLTFAGVLYVAWWNATQAAQFGGEWTFSIRQLVEAGQAMGPTQQAWVLGALMAGFAVKVPLFPVHTWLPLAHTEAPTSGSVILAGVMLKLGTYGLLRFALPMAPGAAVTYAPLIAAFAIVGILYAALICWVQDDIKKLVAYSSISHLGFCVLGMFALNAEGIGGSVMYMVNHGLSTGALFLCVGMIYSRYHTRDMERLSGLGKRLPVWSTFMVFFCLASVGLPGLNGFVGEFLTLLGTFIANGVLGISFAVIASLGLILGAIYILYMIGRVIFGPVKEPAQYAGKVKDLSTREIVVLAPIAVMCLVLGLYPTPLLKALEPAVERMAAGTQRVMDRRHVQEVRPLEMAPFNPSRLTSRLHATDDAVDREEAAP